MHSYFIGYFDIVDSDNFSQMSSLRGRRKRGRGRGERTREKNGGLGARDEGTP